LQALRTQEFYRVSQSLYDQAAPERARHEAVRVKPKIQQRPWEVKDWGMWKVCPGKATGSRASPRERLCELQAGKQ
jgi:hypothetical protein